MQKKIKDRPFSYRMAGKGDTVSCKPGVYLLPKRYGGLENSRIQIQSARVRRFYRVYEL